MRLQPSIRAECLSPPTASRGTIPTVFGQGPGSAHQDPAVVPGVGIQDAVLPDQGLQGAGLLQQLELLGWVDRTALAVLATFFVIGLFKGLIWQTSRIAILVASYLVAGRFGQRVGEWLARSPMGNGEAAPGAPVADTPDTTLYLAYVLLFLAVLVVLSLLAMLLQKLAAKAGLGFFDRLGGGVLGVATGSCIVLFGLFVVHMFFKGSALAHAAESSHSLRLSRLGIDWLGSKVPDDLRTVLELSPLDARGPAGVGEGTQGREFHLPMPAQQPAQPGEVREPQKPRR